MHPTDKAARIAGAIYVSMLVTGPFSLMYVPSKLIVRGDATATAGNILSHEMLWRFGIVADLIGSVIFVCLAIALYRLFRDVDRTQARLLVGFVLVSAAVGFLNVANHLAALTLFRADDFLAVFDKPQREAMGMLFLRLYSHGITVNEIFWGLWLLPFGILVIRSGFLPRILGWWLILNCVAYVAISLTGLLAPPYEPLVSKIAFPAMLGELAMMLWLVVKGAKVRPLAAAAA